MRSATWAAYAALLVVVVGVVFLTVRNAQQSTAIACQSRYTTTLAGVLAERGHLADEVSAAGEALQVSLNLAVLPSETAARVADRKTYVAALRVIGRERAAIPIPVEHC